MMDGLHPWQEEALKRYQLERRLDPKICIKCKKIFKTEAYRTDGISYKNRFGSLTCCPYCNVMFLLEPKIVVKEIKENIFVRMRRLFK
jgi:hypothetical protein